MRKAASGISIFLEEHVNEIEETVIIGNRKVSKANATSAHTVIKADELAQTPVSNVMSLLQGRVAGILESSETVHRDVKILRHAGCVRLRRLQPLRIFGEIVHESG